MVAGEYVPPPEVAAELAALPGERDATYLDCLRNASLEVLVSARRRTANPTLRTRVDRIVFERTEKPITDAAIRHGHPPPGEDDEVADEVKVMFWIAILRPSFFEIRFNLAMLRSAQQAGERIRSGLQRDRERRALRGQPGVDYPERAVEDEYPAIDQRILFQEGLTTLSDRQARALVLVYEDDLPIFSKDPDVVTVASTLDCSERTARRLVAEGLDALGLWYEQQVAND